MGVRSTNSAVAPMNLEAAHLKKLVALMNLEAGRMNCSVEHSTNLAVEHLTNSVVARWRNPNCSKVSPR